MQIIFTDHSTDKTYRPTLRTIDRLLAECKELGGDEFNFLLDCAVEHWYGKRCTFWLDHGLREQGIFGQVIEPSKTGGYNCVTSRIRIDMKVNGHDVINGSEFWNSQAWDISLDNGHIFYNVSELAEHEEEILANWDVLVENMDDKVREAVHAELAPCTELEFLRRYLELAHANLII